MNSLLSLTYMITYEVTLLVNRKILSAFQEWLKHHVEEMLQFPGFESAEILRDESLVQDKCTLVVPYKVKTREALQDYLDNHAIRMRADGIKKFGDQFSTTRRILHKI